MSGAASRMRQRADLTFKQNVRHGRHGWLRLTPAYSVRLVEGVLDEFAQGTERVLEPFCGTGTTAICAAYRGMQALATDINPFLVWLGRVKAARYGSSQRASFEARAADLAARLREGGTRPSELPRLRNIERWWHAAELEFVTELRGEIDRTRRGAVRDLLDVAFCRTMIALSNAAFNHQSMSFKPGDRALAAPTPAARARYVAQFLSDAESVALSVADNPAGVARIERVDARGLAGLDEPRGSFDLLITSPPYPNRMSYIRELRPYMYWLGYLDAAKEAGELDWQAIGGTWGIATSRLLTWQASDAFIPDYLPAILARIRRAHVKNGELMARYVQKYFDDMFVHFQAAARMLKRGGSAHYIVGNAAFYGHVVPTERLYVDQLTKAGFRRCEVRAIRKRNSKKELIEFHVIAQR
ncbi:MAG TPA: hypothetical protein VK524_26130 [Polyangiaceae bacterium]|nr:hypothetical protein [Polyangiaceae bacterium]